MTSTPRHGQPAPWQTPDPNDERLAQLRRLVPEAFSEGRIDWAKLRAALGEAVDEGPERYTFSWAGKGDALRALQAPTAATLRPCRDESVGFEQTRNVFIEGENLEALKLMLKPYHGRVKMIYIDPPYNTGHDFVYPDDFKDPLGNYMRLTGQVDAEGNYASSNSESSGRYHSAWLSMMYPRLFLARQLLREDGVIFVSIDDHEVHNLRMLMNEVFGEENFVECFIWKKSYGGGAKEKYAVTQHEYILLYGREAALVPELWLSPDPKAESRYYKHSDSRGPYRLKPLEATASMDDRPNLRFPIPLPQGGTIMPKRQWWWSKDRVMAALDNDELAFVQTDGGVTVSYKQYLFDEMGRKRKQKPFSVVDGIYTQSGTRDLRKLFGNELVMQFPKPVDLLRQAVEMVTTIPGSEIVLDFFSGSSTMAHAVLDLNREDGGERRFILVQLPEPTDREDYATIAEIGKERIRRVISKMEAERAGRLDLDGAPPDLGFRVFKLGPSHHRRWLGVAESDPDAYVTQMALYSDPLEPGWRPLDVVWELAIKEGYRLDSLVSRDERVAGQAVYRVQDRDSEARFYVCLDETLALEALWPLELGPDDLFYCRDVALDDEAAANLALQCRLGII